MNGKRCQIGKIDFDRHFRQWLPVSSVQHRRLNHSACAGRSPRVRLDAHNDGISYIEQIFKSGPSKILARTVWWCDLPPQSLKETGDSGFVHSIALNLQEIAVKIAARSCDRSRRFFYSAPYYCASILYGSLQTTDRCEKNMQLTRRGDL